ncbi:MULTISPECIES: aminodeoxychorismate/anthranilate synthase component II [Exiguobacterium]|uniref:Glutamine amidotransferase of anthranilate synthase n=1 Tax=Exiguobacterium sibiricum (strain DSM 17290 / CCUG 55495 / CIP 109462 / JCM 13490 / 255-15) TaxID=262543 RepID=B1YGR2_EXIS2|nr:MULTISPECIES: aminodeoxychorismate/anthranilate synthase component II [Exiguobacterium]ACB59545.1 glutamine amidotransferase of anthranilate synthase [Exiguobacterium sibiricum 255-15]MCT4792410.1 aminodeoxychorismate/anthranilate synthase component II [Exiguobacterium artemiae]MDW2886950.1 aminodeoxychorismate/anthranilate synthase component II [Exiguobacterium sibiricum]
MIVLIDNYDSFTYNVVQYFGELGQDIRVFRNDAITIEEIEQLAPDHLVISPGPCTPNEAGISLEAIRYFAGRIPILGICLGHQAIGQVFGGKVVRAKTLMHGKVSLLTHDGSGMFSGIEQQTPVTRYHSLVVERESFPDILTMTAEADGEVMALRHKEWPIVGVQFHPEAILTRDGKQMLKNFLELTHYVSLA